MLEKLVNVIDSSSTWIGKTVSWMCLLMIIVLVYEIVSRYFFGSPTTWAHESTTMLYGTFCMIGAVWTLREKGHVRSEVIYQLFPKKMQLFCDIIVGILVLGMLLVFFDVSSEFAADSWKSNEVSSKSTWGVPVYPFKTVIPLTVFLMFFQQLAHLIRDLMAFFGHPINRAEDTSGAL